MKQFILLLLFSATTVGVVAQTPATETATAPAESTTAVASDEPSPGGDTLRLKSGLTVVFTHRGDGRRAKAKDLALVHYTGRLTNGKVFDSSIDREAFAFRVGAGQVIRGWDEAFALMRVGDKATLTIPAKLAYGEKGAGDRIPPNSTLVFDVELLDLKKESVGATLSSTIDRRGIEQAQKIYNRLKKSKFDGYYLGESELNMLGYKYLKEGKHAEAIAVFSINVDAFPQSGNVYDSLGEACMEAGDTKKAIANYERSLELDPKNANAKEMLKKLRAQ